MSNVSRASAGRTPARVGVLSTLVAASLVLSACSGAAEDEAQSAAEASASAAASSSAAPKAKPTVSVKNNATDVSVTAPIKVQAEDGLKAVTMTNESGKQVKGALSKDGLSWSTAEVLGFNRSYTLVAEGKNGTKSTVNFSTPSPAYTTGAALSPLPGSEVGVGQTIGIRFSSAITDRKAAQKAIEIETTPHVDGAFYWLNDYEVRWRPQYYWEPGTKVKVKANIYGADLGGGVFGAEDNATDFVIGDRVIAIVDDAKKTMDVYRNKQLLRSIPVSLGMDTPRWATPNGRYIVGDEHTQLMMDSTTYGYSLEDGGYKTMVDYATQMSYSGIYVHSAPWSVWAQGYSNTSHGCVNVTPEAAQWFQATVKRGDIVHVMNTQGGTLPVTDGLGDWNLSWEEWSAGNA